MSTNVKPFTGEWYVWWTSSADLPLHLEPRWRILIGTGDDSAGYVVRKPFLDDEYQVCVGCAVYEPTGGGWRRVLPREDEPLALILKDGALRWCGLYDGNRVRIYISLSEALSAATKEPTYSLYGTTVAGDPDQVAVWGANDTPPPPPPPP